MSFKKKCLRYLKFQITFPPFKIKHSKKKKSLQGPLSWQCASLLSVAYSSFRDIKESLDGGRPLGILQYEALWCHSPCYLCVSDTYLQDMTWIKHRSVPSSLLACCLLTQNNLLHIPSWFVFLFLVSKLPSTEEGSRSNNWNYRARIELSRGKCCWRGWI